MISKTKQVLLTIAIAIIFALFVGYGISTFYESPKYYDFCPEYDGNNYDSKESCEENDGKWDEFDKPMADGKDGYCNRDYLCRQELNNAREPYNRNVFIICLIIGIVAVIAGGIFINAESVGSGIMGGGILTLIYGIIRYWGDAADVLRFIILGVVLGILIWIGYTKLNTKEEKHRKRKN